MVLVRAEMSSDLPSIRSLNEEAFGHVLYSSVCGIIKIEQMGNCRTSIRETEPRRFLMGNCDLLAQCPFFNDKMANMPISSAYIKQIYCRTDNSSCARYIVVQALGKEHVPFDLFPSEMIRAKRIIARGRVSEM